MLETWVHLQDIEFLVHLTCLIKVQVCKMSTHCLYRNIWKACHLQFQRTYSLSFTNVPALDLNNSFIQHTKINPYIYLKHKITLIINWEWHSRCDDFIWTDFPILLWFVLVYSLNFNQRIVNLSFSQISKQIGFLKLGWKFIYV